MMKDITGYEGLYAITDNGKVWSYRSKLFLALKTSKTGYKECALRHGRAANDTVLGGTTA